MTQQKIRKTTPDPDKVLTELHAKFGANLQQASNLCSKEMLPIEQKTRAIATFGGILSAPSSLPPYRKEIASICDEVFADLTTALYFAACALDKPSQLVLRRALELGVAIVYLWDMPHRFYGWKLHDIDLSFKEMIEHLNSNAFKAFVNSENEKSTPDELLSANKVNAAYRVLSNTIHGKISTFESTLPNRFSHSADDLNLQLNDISLIQDFLLELWEKRFPTEFSELLLKLPTLKTLR